MCRRKSQKLKSRERVHSRVETNVYLTGIDEKLEEIMRFELTPKLNNIIKFTSLGLGISLVSACNDSSNHPVPPHAETSTATCSVTDAPVDAVDGVKLTLNRLELNHADGDIIKLNFSEPVVIPNLLNLTGNIATPIISDATIPAGNYQWIRLFIEGGYPDSTVSPKLGNEADLFIPGQQNTSNVEQSLLLNSGFTAPTGGEAAFTIDFVLRKALTKPANADYYLLRPALRLVNDAEVGTIAGTVDSTVIASNACSDLSGHSVYLYEGDINSANQRPEDFYDPSIAADQTNAETEAEVGDTSDLARPISSAEITQNDSGAYTFKIGFVEATAAGYSVALTCQSAFDEPDSDDDINFTNAIPVDVDAGQTSNVRFSVAPNPPSN